MISTIIFSKERPLQLFAYIESLLHYSGLPEQSIYVLYRDVPSTPYDALKQAFPKVNWVAEQDFYRDLMAIVAACDDYILWGCDDVFFKSPFDPQVCVQALANHESLLAFSLRLGRNIQPTQPLQAQDGYWVWDWTTSPLVNSDWTYPWEVSASIYRKGDVAQVLGLTDNLKNPNLLEGLLATYYFETHGRFWRKQLACFEISKSITLQINQVQDVYTQNEFDRSQSTTIDQLYQYFLEGRRLDWQAFENCLNPKIHVDSQYFRLRDERSVTQSSHPKSIPSPQPQFSPSQVFQSPLLPTQDNQSTLLQIPSTQTQGNLSPEDCLDLAKIFVAKGCPSEAIAYCEQAIALRPHWAVAYQQLGYVYQIWGGHFSQAEAAYQQAITLDSQATDPCHWLGALYQEAGQISAAINAYQQAIARDVACYPAHWNLGHILRSQGNYAEAIQHHTVVLQAVWDAPIVDYDLVALCNQGLAHVALPYALQLLRRNLHHPSAGLVCHGVANGLLSQGQYAQAIALSLQILHHQPGFEPLLNVLRECLEKLDRKHDAISCFVGTIPHRLIAEFVPNSANPRVTFRQKQPTGTTYQELAAAQPAYWSPAVSVTPSDHQYMIGGAWSYAPKSLATIEQGEVWSDPRTTAVFSSTREVIEDLSYGNSLLVASSQRLPPVQPFTGTLAVLPIRYSGNYCHWMFEFVARAGLLKSVYPQWEGIDGILIDPAQARFQQETLQALGLPEHKLIRNTAGVHLKADRLVVPSLFAHWPIFDRETCQLLRDLFLDDSQPRSVTPTKRIYLTRAEANYRRVLNELEVVEWLQKVGFVSVTLSELSVREQAALLAEAAVVVAPHGAGLTNLVFCQPGTKVLEIFPKNYSQPYYWALAGQCQLTHQYLTSRSVTEYASSATQVEPEYLFNDLEDLVIHLDDLAKALASLAVDSLTT
jgi:tetratricopeptide (TPR) repeat protein